MAAAMYETSVVSFMGFRLLATIGAAALWLWASTTSGMPLGAGDRRRRAGAP